MPAPPRGRRGSGRCAPELLPPLLLLLLVVVTPAPPPASLPLLASDSAHSQPRSLSFCKTQFTQQREGGAGEVERRGDGAEEPGPAPQHGFGGPLRGSGGPRGGRAAGGRRGGQRLGAPSVPEERRKSPREGLGWGEKGWRVWRGGGGEGWSGCPPFPLPLSLSLSLLSIGLGLSRPCEREGGRSEGERELAVGWGGDRSAMSPESGESPGKVAGALDVLNVQISAKKCALALPGGAGMEAAPRPPCKVQEPTPGRLTSPPGGGGRGSGAGRGSAGLDGAVWGCMGLCGVVRGSAELCGAAPAPPSWLRPRSGRGAR